MQSVEVSNSSIWSIDRTLSSATTQDQREPGSDDNEKVLYISQSTRITGASLSDCLVSYPEYSLEESYPFAKIQSVYSTAPANWDCVSIIYKVEIHKTIILCKLFVFRIIAWKISDLTIR